ncbi:cartilage intermediate layer protein 1-like [Branchiostoma floridae x Branchiostoma belcheri]
MDGQVVDYTSETGMFEFTTETTASKISLTFRDYFKILVTSTRVLSLTGSDTLNFDVVLKLKPPPVTIMATETSVIDLGTVEGALPVAEIDIPANSFFTSDGNLFEGEVKASVSFVDPRNEEDFEFIQGELTAVDAEGQENTMQTFGMFTLDFETEEGDALELGANLTVHIDPSESNIDTNDVDENGNLRTKIWFLDSDSGLWTEAGNLRVGTASRRRKRSTFIIGEFLYIADYPCNFDRIEPYNRRCFVNVRAYNSIENFVHSMATGRATGLVNQAEVAVITTSNRGGFRFSNSLSVYRRGWTNAYSYWAGGGVCLETLCEPTGNDFSARVNVVKDGMHLVAVDKSLYTGFDADLHNSIEVKDDGKTLSFDVFRPDHRNGPIYTYYDRYGCYYPTGASSHFAFVNNAYQPYVFPPYTFDQNQYSQPITVTSWYPNENELKKVCFIKVFVKFDTDHAQTEIRVTSRGGGVYAPNTGVIYGIREDRTKTNPNDPKSAFVCVEFKCPGPILESQPDGTTSPPYPGANDNTRITVVARNNICKHDSRLTSTMTAGIDTDLLLEVSDVVRNENTVEFTVPNGNDFGRDYGTYVKTGSGYTGYGEALEYCRSGSDTGGTGKPLVYNKYHAIRFNCGDNFEFTTEKPGVVTEAEEEIATAGMATQDRESSTYTTLRTEQTTGSTTNANTQGTTAQEGTTAPSWTRYSDNDDYRTGDFGATRGTEASTQGTNTPWRDYYDYNYDDYNYDYIDPYDA